MLFLQFGVGLICIMKFSVNMSHQTVKQRIKGVIVVAVFLRALVSRNVFLYLL